VIDLKDEWTTLKGQLAQQMSIIREVMRTQDASGNRLDHEEWSRQHAERQSEVSHKMDELREKLQAHEVGIQFSVTH